MKLTIYFILVLNIIPACKPSLDKDKSAKIIILNHNADKNTALLPDTIFEEIVFTPLETSNESIIGTFDKLEVKEDRFYILDTRLSNALFVFDKSGNFKFKIRAIGKGLGEFTHLNDFCIYKNQILLLGHKKVLFYNLDGDFIEEKKIKWAAWNISVLDEQNVFLFDNSHVSKNKFCDYHIIKTNFSFNKNKGYLKPIQKELHSSYRFQLFNDSLYIVSPQCGDYTLYKYQDNKIIPYLKFDFGKYNIPRDKLNTEFSIELSMEELKPYIKVRNFILGSKLTYINYSQNGTIFMGLYFLTNGKFISGARFNNCIILPPSIHYINKNKLYSIIDAERLLRFDNVLRNKSNDVYKMMLEENSSLQNTLQNISAINNPIIATYKLKEGLYN